MGKVVRNASCPARTGSRRPGTQSRTDSSARLIANPGCYPTAVQLGFMPLVESGLVDMTPYRGCQSQGFPGPGARPRYTLFSEASDNFKAHGVPGASPLCRKFVRAAHNVREIRGLTFVPHPASRSAAYMQHCTHGSRKRRISECLRNTVSRRAFVDVLPAWVAPGNAFGAFGKTRIASFYRPQGRYPCGAVVIDNLVKERPARRSRT